MHRSPLFTPSLLSEISNQLVPRARMQVPFNRAGLRGKEAEMFKQRSKLKASVFIPLVNYRNKACLLYTLRTDKVSTHPNEISFPGGHADHTDQSLLHSALREFHEELGVHFRFSIDNQLVAEQLHVSTNNTDSTAIIESQPFMSNSNEPGVNALDLKILGSLFDSVPSKHGTSVQPIVGYVKLSKLHEIKKSDLIEHCLNPHRNEVAKVFCVPVDELTNPRNQREEKLERRGTAMRYTVPSSPGDIWGLTGFLTQQLINHVLIPAMRNQLRYSYLCFGLVSVIRLIIPLKYKTPPHRPFPYALNSICKSLNFGMINIQRNKDELHGKESDILTFYFTISFQTNYRNTYLLRLKYLCDEVATPKNNSGSIEDVFLSYQEKKRTKHVQITCDWDYAAINKIINGDAEATPVTPRRYAMSTSNNTCLPADILVSVFEYLKPSKFLALYSCHTNQTDLDAVDVDKLDQKHFNMSNISWMSNYFGLRSSYFIHLFKVLINFLDHTDVAGYIEKEKNYNQQWDEWREAQAELNMMYWSDSDD